MAPMGETLQQIRRDVEGVDAVGGPPKLASRNNLNAVLADKATNPALAD